MHVKWNIKRKKTWYWWINFGFADWKEQKIHVSFLIWISFTHDCNVNNMKMISTWLAEFSNANKRKEIEQHIKKNMTKKQLSSSTFLFRQGAMSWTFPVVIHERKLYNSLGTCTSIFSSDRSAGSAWNGGDGLERLNAYGTSQDQCRIKHMLCLF